MKLSVISIQMNIPHQFYSGSSSAGAAERIVVENHVDTTVQLEKDTIGKVAYEYIKEQG